MFNLIRRRTLHHCKCFSSIHEFNFLQHHPFSSSSSNSSKKSIEKVPKSLKKHPFTISYLINSCGLSQERAILASNRVSFTTPEKPDLFLNFLKNFGFSDSQISVLIRKYPRLLVSDPNKYLTPKFQYLESLGLSRLEIIALVTKSQNMLFANLDSQIIPNFNLLASFFSSQNETVFCIKRYPDILSRSFESKVSENIRNFCEKGVPKDSILGLLKRQPRSFMTSSDKVKETLEELTKIGFDPIQKSFVTAAYVMIASNRLIWKEKIEVFKKWGFSEDEVMVAFRLNPWCMAASKQQIEEIMEFFVRKVGFDPPRVIELPIVFSLSLKRSIIPRYSVYQVLLSKGLVKKELKISMFKYPKAYFLDKFVLCHSKDAPELLKLFLPTT